MTEEEVTAARAQWELGPAAIPSPRRRFSLFWALWLLLVGFIFVLELMHPPRFRRHHSGRPDTMEYRGQEFKMRKAYETYEDYKDDPNNLDTNELGHIEETMISAEVPKSFKNRDELIRFAIYDLRFPGYGLRSLRGQSDDNSELAVEAAEIPQRDKDRVIVVQGI